MGKKKIIIIILITMLLILISFSTVLFITVFKENKANSENIVYHFEKDFKILLEDVKLVKELDTRGFLGDGTLYQIIDLSNQKEEVINKLSNWDIFNAEDYRNIIKLTNNNEITFIYNKKLIIPNIENVYAKYINRNIDDPNWEYSHNYSFAVYDKENQLLYYVMDNS